jgi:iron-sulfur cluster assembly protein
MSIRLTTSAAQRVASFLAERPSAVGLRFGVKRTGCSGWAYVVDIVDTIGSDDREFIDQGIRVLVDAASLPMVDGTEIDYAKHGLGAQFVFNNPNVAAQCGCGESFTTAAQN